MMPGPWAGQFVVIHWPHSDQSSSKRRAALLQDEPDAHGDRAKLQQVASAVIS